MLATGQATLVRSLHGSSGAVLTLTHYAAGERQDRHDHDHTQVSFLLAGSICETIGRRPHEVRRSGVCVKRAGVDHDNIWGKTGALMLTARLRWIDEDDFAGAPLARWEFCPAPDARLVAAVLQSSASPKSDDNTDDIIADLIASLGHQEVIRGTPAAWVSQVEEAVWDGEPLHAAGAAKLAGIHRAHFSRAFAAHVGIPFSVYRRHVMLSRAIERSVRSGDSLALVAADAGFVDQSHMNRVMGASLGTSPRALRRALTAA